MKLLLVFLVHCTSASIYLWLILFFFFYGRFERFHSNCQRKGAFLFTVEQSPSVPAYLRRVSTCSCYLTHPLCPSRYLCQPTSFVLARPMENLFLSVGARAGRPHAQLICQAQFKTTFQPPNSWQTDECGFSLMWKSTLTLRGSRMPFSGDKTLSVRCSQWPERSFY